MKTGDRFCAAACGFGYLCDPDEHFCVPHRPGPGGTFVGHCVAPPPQ